jgi:hypothetical protein
MCGAGDGEHGTDERNDTLIPHIKLLGTASGAP